MKPEVTYCIEIKTKKVDAANLNAEIEILNSKLEESNQARAELESKINKTLEEIKTADNDKIKNHLEKLEKVITIFVYFCNFDK